MEIMAAMVEKYSLFTAVPGDERKWLFDPVGATQGDDGTVDRCGVHRVAVRRRLSH